MGNKTIYIRQEDEEIFERAENLIGKESLSRVITQALRRYIKELDPNLVNTVDFMHEEELYQIKVFKANGYRVQVYKDDNPASIFRYGVDADVDFDFRQQWGKSAVDELINIAKSDICEKRGLL